MRKKEILDHPLDATETPSLDSAALLTVKPVTSTRSKKKPVQPKMTTEVTTEVTEVTEATVSTEVIDMIEIIVATENTDPTVLEKITSTEDIKTAEFTGKMNKKQRKETHSKEKFYIRNDLLERLKTLTKGKGNKNLKTLIINEALEKALDELE